MRILGIDPGLNITGYGLIEGEGLKVVLIEAGFIKTKLKRGVPARLEHIYNAVSKLVNSFKPQVMVLEKVYSHWKHPITASALGHARGAVTLCAQQNTLAIIEYSATRIKKAVTGNGHASKLQIQRVIQNLFSLKDLPQPPDIADALAIACAHSYILHGTFSCQLSVFSKNKNNKFLADSRELIAKS